MSTGGEGLVGPVGRASAHQPPLSTSICPSILLTIKVNSNLWLPLSRTRCSRMYPSCNSPPPSLGPGGVFGPVSAPPALHPSAQELTRPRLAADSAVRVSGCSLLGNYHLQAWAWPLVVPLPPPLLDPAPPHLASGLSMPTGSTRSQRQPSDPVSHTAAILSHCSLHAAANSSGERKIQLCPFLP